MTKWHFKKHDKYNQLARLLREKGWKTLPICVEVGARGRINHKWHHFTKAMGFKKAESKSLQKKVARVAQRCSFYIYCARKNKDWFSPPLLQSYGD